MVTDNLEKLTWAKEIEVTICPDENVKVKKSKGNIRNLLIKDIEDVYNGINNSNVIANYVKAYPEEGKEANNGYIYPILFFTIINFEFLLESFS